ncbi:hypothetical protein [Lactobacillus crispatus]|uniref:Uncharacterized protein n=1 Tax=Lactobacillus crispatus TaxID=47770 RepID=A0A6A1Z7A0_9LACO|nr:hypothetical protein [Lactobacillus crispatus]KAB1977207.1 hypothetical protein F8251_03865 [Lactobacillus crispatus]MCT3538051.1 hypothetical protein [Lactobacillus crispatus]
MLEIDYSELFRNAHEEAHEIVNEVGDYMVAFKIALTNQWKVVKTMKLNNEQIAKLENDGWARWTKGNFDRLYFNPDKNGVLELTYHDSGTINTADWNGDRISNGEAYRIKGMKCWVDIDNAKIQVRFYGSNGDEAEMLQTAAQKSLDKAIA